VRAVLRRQFNDFERRLRTIARADTRARLLMTTPSVGVIVALTFACAIDDPSWFKSSKAAGAHFGMTLTRNQSGETDYSGRISKNGDGSVRAVLYEARHLSVTRPLKGRIALKSWAMRIAKRAGMKKATVALTRKLAVIMHRMLVDGTPFTTQPAVARPAEERVVGELPAAAGQNPLPVRMLGILCPRCVPGLDLSPFCVPAINRLC
jgi:transposase